MAEQEEIIKTCDECGAAIYPDHLEKGTAGMVNEKLLCPVCFREYNKQNVERRMMPKRPSPWSMMPSAGGRGRRRAQAQDQGLRRRQRLRPDRGPQ